MQYYVHNKQKKYTLVLQNVIVNKFHLISIFKENHVSFVCHMIGHCLHYSRHDHSPTPFLWSLPYSTVVGGEESTVSRHSSRWICKIRSRPCWLRPAHATQTESAERPRYSSYDPKLVKSSQHKPTPIHRRRHHHQTTSPPTQGSAATFHRHTVKATPSASTSRYREHSSLLVRNKFTSCRIIQPNVKITFTFCSLERCKRNFPLIVSFSMKLLDIF